MRMRHHIQGAVIIISSTLIFGCSVLSDQKSTGEKSVSEKPMPMKQQHESFGNSDNVKIVNNPTMMFHDIIIKPTPEGAELEGKVHVRGHHDYIPGHIDIVVVDRESGKNITALTTDFNSRVARHGRYNFKHANNIGTRLPGVDPEKTTVVVAYHYSNVDRLSMSDCGANVAISSLAEKEK